MLYYELKKWFSKKKVLCLSVLFLLIGVYTIFGMINVAGLKGNPDPFLSFLGFWDNFVIFTLLMVIFGISPFFAREIELGAAPVLVTLRKGKGDFISTKIKLALVYANLLFLLFIVVSMIGYGLVYKYNFNVPVNGEYAMELTVYPWIKTQGNILLIRYIGNFLGINFMALLSLLVSKYVKKSFVTAVVLVLGIFVLGFIPDNIPFIGYVFGLSPICLAGRASTYRVLFVIGNHSVIILHIGFLVYMIGILLLYKKIKQEYKIY